MRRRNAPILLFALAVLLGCPQRYSVKLRPGSTADTLTLLLGTGHPQPLALAYVATCGRVDDTLAFAKGDLVWRIEGWGLPDSIRRYPTLRYGDVPAGFREVVPAKPLVPGCYIAGIMAQGGASLHFWVDSLRTIRLWTDRNADSAAAWYSRSAAASNLRADSAVSQCLTRYRTATTRSDTAATDAWVPVKDMLSPDPLTCRGYRRLYWSRFQQRPWAEASTSGA